MPDLTERAEQAGLQRAPSVTIALESVASSLRASDGREVPFARAILVLRNSSPGELTDLALRASLGQEGGTVQDVSAALSGAAALPPGGALRWDVYDLLLPAHPGTASKIHMFGYRAALNWRFDLEAWAEYRLPGESDRRRTPVARWTLRWSLAATPDGGVELTIDRSPVLD